MANDLLNHALALLKGESSRKLHSLPNEGFNEPIHKHGSEHHHHHHHHEHAGHVVPKPRTLETSSQPSAHVAVSQRPRKSLYPIITLEEAYNLLFSNLSTLPAEMHKVDSDLRGHILAEKIVSNRHIPMSPSSNVDGYAVSCRCTSFPYPIRY